MNDKNATEINADELAHLLSLIKKLNKEEISKVMWSAILSASTLIATRENLNEKVEN